MTGHEEVFRRSYAFTLRRYLRRETEDMLHAAYELGRQAVVRGFSVLDVAQVHHAALAAAIRDAVEADGPARMTERAGDLLLESLAAFEMVRRGFGEAEAAAAEARHQARLVRGLSALLADASLVAGAEGSLEEMLHVVAEQARELTGADVCRVRLDAGEAAVTSVCADDGSWDERAPTGWPRLRLVAAHGRSAGGRAAQDRLSEPLTALDGRRLGELEIEARIFGDVDRAVLRQVAQMASAAVERRVLHRNRVERPGPRG